MLFGDELETLENLPQVGPWGSGAGHRDTSSGMRGRPLYRTIREALERIGGADGRSPGNGPNLGVRTQRARQEKVVPRGPFSVQAARGETFAAGDEPGG